MTTAKTTKDEYRTALYKAATKAATLLEEALDPNKTSFKPMELDKVNISLKLLAIIEKAPSPDKL